jgi:hypothetical protein
MNKRVVGPLDIDVCEQEGCWPGRRMSDGFIRSGLLLKRVFVFMGMIFFMGLTYGQSGGIQPDTLSGVEVYGEPMGGGIRLDYGLNLGGYLANKNTANYYNGSGAYTAVGNQGTLAQILNPSNTFNYGRIRQDVGYDFSLHGLPMDMRYSPAMMLGLYAIFHLGQKVAVIAESNFTRLKAEDQFTLKLERFSNIEGDNIERYYISGTEERVDIRLGLQYTFVSETSDVHPFVEAGMTATDTKAKNNIVRIANQTYGIHFPGTSQYFPERDFGLGLGAHASIGLAMDVSEDFRFAFGYSTTYNKINLGNNNESGFQHSLFVRLSLSSLFSGAQD